MASAKEFRSFWGSKSELRRFQDGSINEAVLWPCVNAEEKKMICRRITKHLLNLHCNIPESSVAYYGDQFNCVLKSKFTPVQENSKSKPGCGEEEFVHIIKTFDEFCKQIRSLDGLPLKINSIHPVDPVFRMTEIMTPRQFKQKRHVQEEVLLPKFGKKCPSWKPAYKVLLQFETSGKWPDELTAIQHIKAAFHIKIAECLQKQSHLVAQPTPTFVDIVKNGYVFRLSVVHYREMVLFKESSATGVLKEEHELAGKQLDILIVKKPLHHSLIHSLNSRFHAYALTTRLCKKWIASQMISSYFCDELVELMVAYLFLTPSPYEVPSCHSTGFFRFLNLLSKFDWENEAMVVNLNDQLKGDDYIVIREHFTANRQQLPTMFVATPYDKETSVWTKQNPSKQILRRVSVLATAALDLISDTMSQLSDDVVSQIFRPCLDDYDVVIELNKDFAPLRDLKLQTNSLKDKVVSTCLPVVEFDPAQRLLEELREAYSNVALFFYNVYGGLHICVVWKNAARVEQPFKILHAEYKTFVKAKKLKKSKKRSSTPFEKDEMMKVNIPAILSDFRVIGEGLVTNVKENERLT